jgi:hypothetical protein
MAPAMSQEKHPSHSFAQPLDARRWFRSLKADNFIRFSSDI